MKKVITDMRSICFNCRHKLTKEEADRLHCPYCKGNLYVISYPWRNRLVEMKGNDNGKTEIQSEQ